MYDCCVICLEELDEDCVELECKHRFHSKCIKEWFKVKNEMLCPLCKEIRDYTNKRKTRSETLFCRLKYFNEKYFETIENIQKNENKEDKLVSFEKLLKLIKNNKYALNDKYFRNNVKKCMDKAREIVKFLNYNYWIEELKLY